MFCKEWVSLEVPDLYNVLVNHPHIKIDSPTTDEDIQKILNRFSEVNVTSTGHHMTHAQIYCAIFDVAIKVRTLGRESYFNFSTLQAGLNYMKTIRLQPYLKRNVVSLG